jgi:hypothetical protein
MGTRVMRCEYEGCDTLEKEIDYYLFYGIVTKI